MVRLRTVNPSKALKGASYGCEYHAAPRNAEAVAGDVDDAVLDLEDVVGVGVKALAADKGFKVAEVIAVEENDSGLVRRNLLRTSGNGS